jgi:sortase A
VKRRRSRRLAALAVVLPAAGAAFIADALYIPAKAALAQILLERAWARAQAGEADAKPWPWADITPVAKIEFPRLNRREIVLEGASGAAMAFGPGHMPNSAAIGAAGTAIVAAHRDTQFRFLGDLVSGDRIAAQTIDGRLLAYHVSAARIVRADASGLDPADAGPGGARLALVTCYPFSGVLHSPWRYVVIADRDPAD